MLQSLLTLERLASFARLILLTLPGQVSVSRRMQGWRQQYKWLFAGQLLQPLASSSSGYHETDPATSGKDCTYSSTPTEDSIFNALGILTGLSYQKWQEFSLSNLKRVNCKIWQILEFPKAQDFLTGTTWPPIFF